MERVKNFWSAFRDIAIIFSFVVNLILVLALLILGVPGLRLAFTLKSGLVEPLLDDLDAAFVGLGEAEIDTAVKINEPIPINFTLPISQTMPLNFRLALEQDTAVVLQQPVPLNLPAQFNLPGGGGVINGYVSLSLPAGTSLPVHLSMIVPVNQPISVRMNVPVSQMVPVEMTVPVRIELGEAGLDPAVERLRAVFKPLREQIESLPDSPF